MMIRIYFSTLVILLEVCQNENLWHFHTENPGTDLGSELNPHFDSLEGLLEETAFLRDPEGLDCSIFLSSLYLKPLQQGFLEL